MWGQRSVLPTTCKMKRRQSFCQTRRNSSYFCSIWKTWVTTRFVCIMWTFQQWSIPEHRSLWRPQWGTRMSLESPSTFSPSRRLCLGTHQEIEENQRARTYRVDTAVAAKKRSFRFKTGFFFFFLPQNLLFSRLACQAARVKLTLRDILRRSLIFNFEKQ